MESARRTSPVVLVGGSGSGSGSSGYIRPSEAKVPRATMKHNSSSRPVILAEAITREAMFGTRGSFLFLAKGLLSLLGHEYCCPQLPQAVTLGTAFTPWGRTPVALATAQVGEPEETQVMLCF